MLSAHGIQVAGRLSVGELTIGARDRLLVHGPNGAGKTTLLRVLAGELAPDRGIVRRRLALARLMVREVDLLLLDEPTNHLSPALVEELEEALGGFTGALVVVSHDRRLRARFTGEVREMYGGVLVNGGSLAA